MMSSSTVVLKSDEEILFESDYATLTNQRIVSNWRERRGGKVGTEAPLADIASFKKLSGGQEGRMRQGLYALGGGIVLTIIQLSFQEVLGSSSIIETVLFLVSMLAIVVGLYFVINSIFRVRPNTTIVFMVPGSEDVPVYFAGRDNPEADKLTRAYTRAKRGI